MHTLTPNARSTNIQKTLQKSKFFNKYQTALQYAISKSTPRSVYTENIFTNWGTKNEPRAIAMYEDRYNTKVHEISLIDHPSISGLAASPDGVRLSDDGTRLIGLEIKCPYARKHIPGNPMPIPITYWCQMQLQMACTEIEMTHYVECFIDTETDNVTEFIVREVPFDDEFFEKCLPYIDIFKRILAVYANPTAYKNLLREYIRVYHADLYKRVSSASSSKK